MSNLGLPKGPIIPNIKPVPNVLQDHLAIVVENINIQNEELNKSLE